MLAHGEKADISSEATLSCAGTVGLPSEHPAAPRTVLLSSATPSSGHASAPWAFREAVQRLHSSSTEVSAVIDIELELPPEFLFRSWSEAPRQAVILKISNLEDSDGRLAYLIVAVSPRRRLDGAYRTLLEDLRRQIAILLKNVASFEAQALEANSRKLLDKAKSSFFTSVSHELRFEVLLASSVTPTLALTMPTLTGRPCRCARVRRLRATQTLN